MRVEHLSEGVTLYCGDCVDCFEQIKRVDVVITDPPYGINADKMGSKAKGKHYWRDYGEGGWDAERPGAEVFRLIMEASDDQIIWGGNYFLDYLRPSMGWLVWDKTQRALSMADGELAWTSFNNAMRIFSANRVIFEMEGGRDHPTQKPIALMKWCIEYADRHGSADSILDPFMGSGSTGVAAARLDRKFYGIERDEAYFDIACRRISKALAEPVDMFSGPAPARQESLL